MGTLCVAVAAHPGGTRSVEAGELSELGSDALGIKFDAPFPLHASRHDACGKAGVQQRFLHF